MMKIGYAISSEETKALDAVNLAKMAEELGFEYAFISDHFHPWISKQGESPFVWSVLGGIATQTKKIKMITGVTCPIIRIHPAIIAQAAATIETMMPGRFTLGVGTGENLNEHVVGAGWPTIETRLEMLREAIQVIRLLWNGGNESFEGSFYSLEDARIYSLPENTPKIYVAAAGKKSAKLAGEMGDGLINTSPDKKVIDTFEDIAGENRPKFGQITVCYHENYDEALKIAYEQWPTAGFKGQLNQELRIPAYFEQVSKMVKPEDVEKNVVCGADPEKHMEKINKYLESGYDYVYFHQIGNDQAGALKFYAKEILPRFS